MIPQLKAFPSFDQLPLHEGGPPNSAWGLWGDGPDSALGSLNHLTDELVLRTIQEEVKTGKRFGLNLPLGLLNPPLLGRASFEHEVIDKNLLVVNDDVVTFNTQGSSQWDRLRHFAYQQDKKFYNGTTQPDIHVSDRTSIKSLQSWCSRGLAGRGVLIDYASYAHSRGVDVRHFSPHAITLEDVLAIAKEQKVDFRPVDVLFLRMGYIASYKGLDAEEREGSLACANGAAWASRARQPSGCGRGSLPPLRATRPGSKSDVSDNTNTFQFMPLWPPGPKQTTAPTEKEWHLHPILLARWDTPLGELFDLDALAELCTKNGGWSFFFTSVPPNATAIM